MIDFNINLNPNGVDLNTYNCDRKAAENLAYMARFPSRQYGAFPEGFDIEVGEVRDISIPNTGYPFSNCKIYYPEGEGPFPVLFFIHGGSFYGGWQFLDAPLCRQVCRDCHIAVVSPSYVLAPDFPFPLPLIEMYKDLLYLRDHQEELKLDFSRLAIGGGSAGGHHALGLCQIAHERFAEDHICFKYALLFYPFLDGAVPGAVRADDVIDQVMPLESVDATLDLYAPEGLDRNDPLFSPIHMDLEALPPCAVFSGRKDPLNWDFRRFAERVMEYGKVEAVFKTYPEALHGFLESDCSVEAGRDSKDLACELLKRALK